MTNPTRSQGKISMFQFVAYATGYSRWNKGVFGNVLDAARRAEVEVGVAEERAEREDSEETQLELRKAHAEFRQALLVEGRFWSQKAPVK